MERFESEWSRQTHLLDLCRLYAKIRRPVVLEGPVGAGKTSLARELHRLSERRGRLVEVSAGELTETLFVDTLFGHESGAFTGASRRRAGAFTEADGGSLLLDDVAVMPKVVQAAILRVLESGYYRPLGARSDLTANCRLYFASTVPVAVLVSQGTLLPDLASRMGELIIKVPPLRGRRSEIRQISQRVAASFVKEHGWGAEVRFSATARALLDEYTWPGNIRELVAVVERAVVHAAGANGLIEVHDGHLPPRIRDFGGGTGVAADLTPEIVASAVSTTGGNQSAAARLLGVHRNTVRRHLRQASER